MNKQTIEAILGGVKTVETRFSKAKIAPFNQISSGDWVFMKPPGEEPVGQFRVKKVFNFEGLTEDDVKKIFRDYGDQIAIGNKEEDEQYLKQKLGSRYGTLIFISESERFIISPVKIKKSDMRGWMVLE